MATTAATTRVTPPAASQLRKSWMAERTLPRSPHCSGTRASGGGELSRDQPRVEASAVEQHVVGADLDHAALVEHDDPVGAAHRGESMGDHHRRAVLRE